MSFLTHDKQTTLTMDSVLTSNQIRLDQTINQKAGCLTSKEPYQTPKEVMAGQAYSIPQSNHDKKGQSQLIRSTSRLNCLKIPQANDPAFINRAYIKMMRHFVVQIHSTESMHKPNTQLSSTIDDNHKYINDKASTIGGVTPPIWPEARSNHDDRSWRTTRWFN